MTRVYFDTNFYDCIDKDVIPTAEVDGLRAAMARGEVAAHLSVADVEELLGQWENGRQGRQAAVRRLRVARDLIGFKGMLKQPADLLREAIQAYAVGAPQPSPTLPRDKRRLLESCLNRVARGSQGLNHEVGQIVADVRATKEEFRSGMAQALAQTRAELKWEGRDPDERRALTFDAFWTVGAAQWAEALASRVGLADACRARGIAGLLDVRTVRLCVGAAKSLVFSQVVEGRQPDRADGYDLWHAILASVADVFVTYDRRLADHLARIPGVGGFRVARSLREVSAGLGPPGCR